jgi:hypothetical protein
MNEDDAKSNEEEDQMLNFDDTYVFEDIAQSTAERKLDEVEQVIEEEDIAIEQVKDGDFDGTRVQGVDVQGTAQGTGVQGVNVQGTASQSTDRQFLITPRTLKFEEEAGPSNPIQEEPIKHTASDDETISDIILSITRPRGISIPGFEQAQPLQSSS